MPVFESRFYKQFQARWLYASAFANRDYPRKLSQRATIVRCGVEAAPDDLDGALYEIPKLV